MNAIQIVNQLNDKKGQHVKIIITRVLATRQDCDCLVAKRVEMWVRSGISYANLADIREGIEHGTREPVQGLPWGKWREGYTNYIIDHKNEEYVRFYPASFDNLKTKVEYTIDGIPASYEDIESYLLAKEKRKPNEDAPLCFTVKADSVVSIGD